jgi:hypothetical protein
VKSKQQKKLQIEKRIKAQMVGLLIKWDDPDPLNYTDRLVNCEVKHKNPIRELKAGGIYKNFQAMCAHVRMYYRFGVTLHFIGKEPIDLGDMFSFCMVKEINEFIIEQIESTINEVGDEYFTHATMEVECLATHPPAKTIEQKLMEKLESAA